MYKVVKENREQAIKILTSSFEDNPGVLAVVKKDKRIKQRIEVLCQHCLMVAFYKKGAYITSDGKGVALLFKSWLNMNPFQFLIRYFILGQYCIGWTRALSIIKRERKIRNHRPKDKHLYFWMLAVEDRTYGLNTIIEIRDFVFAYSRELQLPIYAETTVEKTLTLYKRYGFQVYDTWTNNEDGIKIYFIYRNWDA